MRNFLFASGDFLNVVSALPCKARAHSVQKAGAKAGNVNVGTFVYLRRD